jgi:hypothetical protein
LHRPRGSRHILQGSKSLQRPLLHCGDFSEVGIISQIYKTQKPDYFTKKLMIGVIFHCKTMKRRRGLFALWQGTQIRII